MKGIKKGGAFWVGAGIFLSRISGLIRERIIAHYFGNSLAGDAFRAALRIPNFLQNLLGEGVLSASFIPAFSKLLGAKDEKEAQDLAGSVFSFLFLTVSVLVVLGITFADSLVSVIAPGFQEEKRALTVMLVKIIFPGTGLLVFSAWCLGILNSYNRFFLSYAAPIIWNLAIIVSLFWGAHTPSSQEDLALWAGYGMVAGSALQFLVQLPVVLGLIRSFPWSFHWKTSPFRSVMKNLVPAVASRGIHQVNAFTDTLFASFLSTGALSALSFAQTLYLLPVSLFGMSVAAAELPQLSRLSQENPAQAQIDLKLRVSRGMDRISFFILPTVFVFIVLGFELVSVVYQSGAFNRQASYTVWSLLAAMSLGLIATTYARLLNSLFYALGRTKLTFFTSSARLCLGVSLVATFVFILKWGPLGIALGSAASATFEYFLLQLFSKKYLGSWIFPSAIHFKKTLFAAALASLFAKLIKVLLENPEGLKFSLLFLSLFGVTYAGLAYALKIQDAQTLFNKIKDRLLR